MDEAVSEELTEITRKLGESYNKHKRSEREKNEWREAFFEQATHELQQELPPQTVAEYETSDVEDALRQAQRQYVKHTVIAVESDGNKTRIVLEQDPAYRPFTYINPSDGQIYKKSVSEGSPVLDDEGLLERDPDLYHRVMKKEVVYTPRDFSELAPEELEELSKYITFPKPQVKLQAPRRATQEELDDA